jgi:hypothetical protein
LDKNILDKKWSNDKKSVVWTKKKVTFHTKRISYKKHFGQNALWTKSIMDKKYVQKIYTTYKIHFIQNYISDKKHYRQKVSTKKLHFVQKISILNQKRKKKYKFLKWIIYEWKKERKKE